MEAPSRSSDSSPEQWLIGRYVRWERERWEVRERERESGRPGSGMFGEDQEPLLRSLPPSLPLPRCGVGKNMVKKSEGEVGDSQPRADTGRKMVEIAAAAASRGIWHCYIIAGPSSQCSPLTRRRSLQRTQTGPKRSQSNIHACGCSALSCKK